MPDRPPSEPSSPPSGSVTPSDRRQLLKRIGQGAVAAGAASPLAAVAGGYQYSNKRKWCKSGGKNVHGTISGCGSVMLSAQADDECYGKPCSWYKYRVPASCGGSIKFKDKFSCAGKTDSSGRSTSHTDCKYNKTFNDLFVNYPTTREAHWATAYCNAVSDGGGHNFPYSPSQINGFFIDDHRETSAAYQFFKNFMQNGGPNSP